MGTYLAWESTATLRLLGGARDAWATYGGGEGRGHIVSPSAQLVTTVIAVLPASAYHNLRLLFCEQLNCLKKLTDGSHYNFVGVLLLGALNLLFMENLLKFCYIRYYSDAH